MAVCVSIIGKDNSPQYIVSTDLDKELELQYRVHAALDVIEEKCSPGTKQVVDSKELYLGLLYSTETHKIYGYVTNTKIKFIIVVDSNNTGLRENEVFIILSLFISAVIGYTNYGNIQNLKKKDDRVQIRVYRGPNNEYTKHATWGFFVKQPAEDDH